MEKHVVVKVDVASMNEMDECMRGVASRNKSDGCDARRVEWRDGSDAWSYDAVEEGSKERTPDPPWTLDCPYSLARACGTTPIPTMDLPKSMRRQTCIVSMLSSQEIQRRLRFVAFTQRQPISHGQAYQVFTVPRTNGPKDSFRQNWIRMPNSSPLVWMSLSCGHDCIFPSASIDSHLHTFHTQTTSKQTTMKARGHTCPYVDSRRTTHPMPHVHT